MRTAEDNLQAAPGYRHENDCPPHRFTVATVRTNSYTESTCEACGTIRTEWSNGKAIERTV